MTHKTKDVVDDGDHCPHGNNLRFGRCGLCDAGLNPSNVHFFDNPEAAKSDFMLGMVIRQGYVPKGCLLSGRVVMAETMAGRDACAGCNCPREKCGGRPRVNP